MENACSATAGTSITECGAPGGPSLCTAVVSSYIATGSPPSVRSCSDRTKPSPSSKSGSGRQVLATDVANPPPLGQAPTPGGARARCRGMWGRCPARLLSDPSSPTGFPCDAPDLHVRATLPSPRQRHLFASSVAFTLGTLNDCGDSSRLQPQLRCLAASRRGARNSDSHRSDPTILAVATTALETRTLSS
jgi:hypothetical protein